MEKLRVISADSHMLEPADLWQQRLDNKFRDQAPKVVENPKNPGYIFVADGIEPFPVAGGFGAQLTVAGQRVGSAPAVEVVFAALRPAQGPLVLRAPDVLAHDKESNQRIGFDAVLFPF